MFSAVYSTGMLWVRVGERGVRGKDDGFASRPTSTGKEGRAGVRGIFGIFQEPLQSGSRCIPLPGDVAGQADRQTVIKWREEGEHHAPIPWCLWRKKMALTENCL